MYREREWDREEEQLIGFHEGGLRTEQEGNGPSVYSTVHHLRRREVLCGHAAGNSFPHEQFKNMLQISPWTPLTIVMNKHVGNESSRCG